MAGTRYSFRQLQQRFKLTLNHSTVNNNFNKMFVHFVDDKQYDWLQVCSWNTVLDGT
jgi:hypothetical protein